MHASLLFFLLKNMLFSWFFMIFIIFLFFKHFPIQNAFISWLQYRIFLLLITFFFSSWSLDASFTFQESTPISLQVFVFISEGNLVFIVFQIKTQFQKWFLMRKNSQIGSDLTEKLSSNVRKEKFLLKKMAVSMWSWDPIQRRFSRPWHNRSHIAKT